MAYVEIRYLTQSQSLGVPRSNIVIIHSNAESFGEGILFTCGEGEGPVSQNAQKSFFWEDQHDAWQLVDVLSLRLLFLPP
jgi:hypothetical protein